MEKYKVCTVEGCDRTMRWGKYCPMHKKRLAVHGSLGPSQPIKAQHRMSAHPLYHTWENMRQRCNNPKHTAYKWYGGRGIKICDRWNDFQLFILDIGDKPEGMTLDRIDNDGDYEPGNVRWSDQIHQLRNQKIRESNKTGTPGVWYDRKYKTYRVSIRVRYKQYTLGSYKKLSDAVTARKQGELKYWR